MNVKMDSSCGTSAMAEGRADVECAGNSEFYSSSPKCTLLLSEEDK